MKKYILLFFTVFASVLASAGETEPISSVDVRNPISSYNYYFNNVGKLEISITLSETKLQSREEQGYLDPDNFQFNKVTGSVEWISGSRKKQMEIVLANQSDNKFRYSAVLGVRDGSSTFEVVKPGGSTASDLRWTSIKNISISYQVQGAVYRIPLFDINSEIPVVGGVANSLSVLDPAIVVDRNHAVINLKTEPSSAGGKLLSLKLTKGAVSYTSKPNLVSQNGTYKVVIKDPLANFEEGLWAVEAEVDLDDSGLGNVLTQAGTKVFMKSEPACRVTNITDKYIVDVNGKASTTLKVQTTGKCAPTLDFTPNIFTRFNVVCKTTVDDLGMYSFELNNLTSIPKDQAVYFSIMNDGVALTNGPHMFINATPKLANFAIDVSQGQSRINFDLPSWVNKDQVAVRLDDLGLTASGDNIEIASVGDAVKLTSYRAPILKKGFTALYELVAKDSIISSSLSVLVNNEVVHQVKLRFVNQTFINKKLEELAELAAEKVRRRDMPDKKAKIKKVLEEIISVAGKVNEVVKSEEVNKVVDELAEGGDSENAAKVMKTIGKVGQWVGTLGPILIPLLL